MRNRVWDWLVGAFFVALIGLGLAPSLRAVREGSTPIDCRTQCTLSGMRVQSVSPYDIGTCRCTELDPPTVGTSIHCRELEEKVWRLP